MHMQKSNWFHSPNPPRTTTILPGCHTTNGSMLFSATFYPFSSRLNMASMFQSTFLTALKNSDLINICIKFSFVFCFIHSILGPKMGIHFSVSKTVVVNLQIAYSMKTLFVLSQTYVSKSLLVLLSLKNTKNFFFSAQKKTRRAPAKYMLFK